MRPDEKSRDYLHGLDGWRAVAILLVLLDHCQPLSPARLFSRVQVRGADGVWLFFAISGLLICSRLLEEESGRGEISMKNFYIPRAFRILPPSMMYLAVIAAFGGIGIIPFEKQSWIAALLFFRNYFHYFHGATQQTWFTGHFWSLSVEEHFYFIFPAIMVFCGRARTYVLSTLVLLSVLWTGVFLWQSPGAAPPYWEQRTEFCFCGFAVAALYAICFRSANVRERVTFFLKPSLGLILGGALILLDNRLWFSGKAGEFAVVILRSLLNPLLLLSVVLHPTSFVTRALETKPLRFVGRISYSLYLWQSLFLTRSFRYPGAIRYLQHPLIGIVCTFACAIGSYYWVETPMIRWGSKMAKRSRFASAETAVNPLAPLEGTSSVAEAP